MEAGRIKGKSNQWREFIPAPLLTSKLIGREAEIQKIWDYLVRDDILRVGIYGIGGVGKTEIVMHIYNKLLKEESFDVFWASVPQDFSNYELQEVIGNALHLNEVSKSKDEKIRAAILCSFLTRERERKSVLILDGLLKHFEFNDVGIPLRFSGLKLVITSRSLDVCRMMLCQAEIKILPLSQRNGDDWLLCLSKLRSRAMPLTLEMEDMAKRIISACAGLPLYINAISTRMETLENMHDWKDMLEKMTNRRERFTEMKLNRIDPLKLSYDFLDDAQLTQCFIFCAFYIGSRRRVSREELTEFLIDVGIIHGLNSRKKLCSRAHANLEKLEDFCLLEGGMRMHDIHPEKLWMRDLIIDMALHIKTEKILCGVDLNIGVEDILNDDLRMEGLGEFSFVIDGTENLSDQSSNCSRVSILMSNNQSSVKMIPDSFFRPFFQLRYLNLSKSEIKELPDSIADMVSLTALVLQCCYKLRHVPHLGQLTLLKKLDLWCCIRLAESPDGLKSLINLEYLDLHETGIKELPPEVLINFSKLQYLRVHRVIVEELIQLKKLEVLSCCFSTVNELNVFARSLTGMRPYEYHIHVGIPKSRDDPRDDMPIVDYAKTVVYRHLDTEGKSHISGILLPSGIQKLVIDSLSGERINWPDYSSYKSIEALEIKNCMDLRVVFVEKGEGCSFPNSGIPPFPNLKELKIESCPKLMNIAAVPTQLPRLASLYIKNCHMIKRLLDLDVLLHLSNLQTIEVWNCRMMEEVTNTYDEHRGNFCIVSPLPNLKRLELNYLPKLRHIGRIRLGSAIEVVEILQCPNIERIPLEMIVLPNGVHAPPSSLKKLMINGITWSNAMEWQYSEAKNLVRQYV